MLYIVCLQLTNSLKVCLGRGFQSSEGFLIFFLCICDDLVKGGGPSPPPMCTGASAWVNPGLCINIAASEHKQNNRVSVGRQQCKLFIVVVVSTILVPRLE